VAQELENSADFGGKAGYSQDSIGVQLRDGIPVDEKELADTQATLAGVGRQSLEGALEERLLDPAAVAKELARIKQDAADAAARATPPIMLGESGQAPADQATATSGAGANA
jgi:hypothetical protein